MKISNDIEKGYKSFKAFKANLDAQIRPKLYF